MQPTYRDNAENCEELAREANGPNRNRLQRLAKGWRALAETQDWLDGRMPPVGLWLSKEPQDQVPRETPLDDPRQKTDWPNTKQSDEPWRGNPETGQLSPDRPKPDLEKGQESNTH
jgi:hypothetical protein